MITSCTTQVDSALRPALRKANAPSTQCKSLKRVIFLSMVYPRAYDRTRGTFCFATCKALANRGHDVRVVSPRSWIECLGQTDPRDDSLEESVGPTQFPPFYYPPGFLQSTHGWWMWKSLQRGLTQLAEEFRPEAIVSYWAHPDGDVAVRLGQQLGIPAGIIVGGSDVLLLPQNPRRKRVITHTLQAADAVFCVSRDLKEKTEALGVASDRVHVVYQGVDEQFRPGNQVEARRKLGLKSAGQIVLWVGKMLPVKGLDVLIVAFAVVQKARPAAQLVLVGDGPLRGALERQVASLGLADKVVFAGMQQQNSLPDWYRAADITALSSHSEGIPNVLRESLACGTRYVSTNVGGISELSRHPCNALVPPADPAALAAAIVSGLTDSRRFDEPVTETWADYVDQLMRHMRAAVVTSRTAEGPAQ